MWFFDASILALEGGHLWIENNQLKENIDNAPFVSRYKERILNFREHHNITARLAYVTFLANAHRLLPYFQSRSIPFILQLYPGGTFAIDQEDVDEKLAEVLLSPLCKKVITTQIITRNYIVNKIGCDPAKIEFIFGGVFDSRVEFNFYRDKKFYGIHKDTIDICFVAHKYGNDLTSKGYDYFVRIAKVLSAKFSKLKFHVVGDYSPDDIPLNETADKFIFYSNQSSSFFADFYPGMDAIISFNRPFVLAPGGFDGFPTGACLEAGFRGVANCISDPLELNATFIDGVDLLILDNDFERSVARLSDLIDDPKKLSSLGEGTWQAFHRTMDLDRQLWARTKIIGDELLKHKGLVAVMPAARSTIDSRELNAATHYLQAQISLLEQDVAHWRQISEMLAKGISNRIFEKTKSIVRRYRKNGGRRDYI